MMSRTDDLARKLVGLRREAISHDVAEDAFHRLDTGLPFKNIFGNRVYRTVVPFESEMQQAIENEVIDAGYDGVDWVKGEVYKQTPAEKAPPGSPPKFQR